MCQAPAARRAAKKPFRRPRRHPRADRAALPMNWYDQNTDNPPWIPRACRRPAHGTARGILLPACASDHACDRPICGNRVGQPELFLEPAARHRRDEGQYPLATRLRLHERGFGVGQKRTFADPLLWNVERTGQFALRKIRMVLHIVLGRYRSGLDAARLASLLRALEAVEP